MQTAADSSPAVEDVLTLVLRLHILELIRVVRRDLRPRFRRPSHVRSASDHVARTW